MTRPIDTDGYARVSTQRQVDRGHGLERYIEDLEAYGIPRDRIFWDVESGASDERKGYNTVLERVRNGTTKKVVVPCFDRFTRSNLALEQMLEEFPAFGAELAYVTGGVMDFITPEGRKQARDQATTAAYWREKNQYAAVKGWERRRRLKKASNPPFGYVVVEDSYVINRNPYSPCPEKTCFDIAQELINTYLSIGTIRGTIQEMCQRYGSVHQGQKNEDFPRDRKNLKAWFQNPVLRGHLAYFGNRGKPRVIAAFANHEPLINPTNAAQVDHFLKMRERDISPSVGVKYPLSGLVFCDCGAKSVISGGRKRRYYCGDLYDALGTRTCLNRGGLLPSDAESFAVAAICDRASTEIVRKMEESALREIDQPEPSELIELRLKLERMRLDPDFAAAIPTVQQKIVDMEKSLRSSHEQQAVSNEALLEVSRDPEFFASLEVLERRFVYTQLIDRLVQIAGRVDRVEFLGGLGIVRFNEGDQS
ncbi:MAG: recombinase family protein [Phormidium tanganyikae FI6-MK23]|jgi:DNA invertase Pin-like site-specific DNA recombinase|nr:recombinase family protein [Phormidium tanganyikae FI6-MK23]